MKTFKNFQEQSKNPYLDSRGRDIGGVYGQNPPIHGLKSGNKYTNDIMDRKGSKELDQYYREPEVMDYFRNQGNKITQTFETSKGPITREYSNPFVNQKASQSKTLPAG